MNFKSKSELEALAVENYGQDFIKRSKKFLVSDMTTREHIATTLLSSLIADGFIEKYDDSLNACQAACKITDDLILTIAATDKDHEDQAND